MRILIRSSLVLPVLLASIGIVSTAMAQDVRCDRKAEAQATALYEEGKRAYRLQKYEAAIKVFEEAYALCGNPMFLLNIGLAYKHMNDFVKAVAFYKSYLKEHPKADNREKVEQRIKEMEAAIEEQKRTKERPPTEVQPPTDVPPKETQIGQEAGGTTTKPETTVAGEQLPFAVEGAAQRRWYHDPIGWTIAAGGVVMVGVGTGLFLHGSGLHDDALAEPDEGEARRLNDSANGYKNGGSILLIAGTVTTALGVVKLILHDPRGSEIPATSRSPRVRATSTRTA